MSSGQPVGILNRDQIIRTLSQQGTNELIVHVMDDKLIFLDANIPLEEAYEQMQQQQTTMVLVKENNDFVGIVDTENILEFILVKNATTATR